MVVIAKQYAQLLIISLTQPTNMPQSQDIIPIGTPEKDTFEYWVYKASKEENLAVCWQECYRIAQSILSKNDTAWREKVEGLKTDERKVATFGDWEAVTYEDKMLVNAVLDDLLKENT